MKVTNPSSTAIESTAKTVGGVILGGAVSKGIFSLLHKEPASTETADAIKKAQNMALLKRGGMVALAGYGAAAITSKDLLSEIVKSACYGIAGTQTLEIVSALSAKSSKAQELASSTNPVKKAVARTLGLACPCDSKPAPYQVQPLAGYRGNRGKRGKLNFAVETAEETVFSVNALDQLVDKGQFAA